MRLAFAVAAHFNPEILIVDEVLAVGDADFQKKCLQKMGQVANEEGRTILFVSHNLAPVEALCARCLYLEEGRLVYDGDTRTAIDRYISSGRTTTGDEHQGRYDLRPAIRTAAISDPLLQRPPSSTPREDPPTT